MSTNSLNQLYLNKKDNTYNVIFGAIVFKIIFYILQMHRRKGKMGGQFRNSTWDPILIVSQILALQFVLYGTLGIWNAFTTALVGLPRSLDCLFSYQYIHVRDNSGQLVITSFVLNSLTGYVEMVIYIMQLQQKFFF